MRLRCVSPTCPRCRNGRLVYHRSSGRLGQGSVVSEQEFEASYTVSCLDKEVGVSRGSDYHFSWGGDRSLDEGDGTIYPSVSDSSDSKPPPFSVFFVGYIC